MSELVSASKEMDDEANTTIRDGFQEPRKRFWMRSRKRPKSDAISVSSMDISLESEMGKKKKRRRITEVASSIFASAGIGNKTGNVLHRSFTIQSSSIDLSFVDNDTDTGSDRKKTKTSVESSCNFTLKSWVLDVAKSGSRERLNNSLSRQEIKRQEAIYELYCGENVFLSDMSMLKDFYYEPLMPSGIFTTDELQTLFGGTTQLIHTHTTLRDELVSLRDENGYTESVGPTILNWISMLPKLYLERCRTQIWAKHLLHEKRMTSKRFQSFLKKRLELPHSVDLWTCIDVPRSRIVKYPLLVKEILKHTPTSHVDQTTLNDASAMLSELLKSIDKTMGDSECKVALSKIHVKAELDPLKCIENAQELITEGPLKDSRGMKLQCFLFDTGFALTRRSRSATKKYTLSFPVIMKNEISIEAADKSLEDSTFKIGEHTLTTEDGHGRRHWLDCFNKLVKSTNIQEYASEVEDKENQVTFQAKKLKDSTRSSVGSVSDNHFSLTLKRTFLKHKRNSIGYI